MTTDDERIKEPGSTPSDLKLLGEALARGEMMPLDSSPLEEITKRLRKLQPQAKGPRPTPVLVPERKRKRRAARDARKLNRA